MSARDNLLDAIANCVEEADEDTQKELLKAVKEYQERNPRVIMRVPFIADLIEQLEDCLINPDDE